MKTPPASPAWASAVEACVQRLQRALGLPGVACGVRLGDAPPSIICAGMASPSLRVPVSPATLFHVGSIGKHMTAVALLMVAERGALSLDDTVGQHLPSLPEAWLGVRVRQLLQHTSGIVDYIFHVPDDRDLANAEVYARIGALPLLFEPGNCWSYSNTNYRIAGDIAAACAGVSFAELMAELFQRAGMQHARLDDGEALVPDHAEPCVWTEGEWRRAGTFYAINVGSADGGVAMSALDAVSWDRALWDSRIVGPSSLDLLCEVTRLPGDLVQPYGLGLNLQTVDPARPVFSHSGAMPGFCAHMLHAPTEALGVMVMTNGVRPPGCRQIAEAVAELASPGLTVLSLAPQAGSADPEDHQVRQLLFRGSQAVDPGVFAPVMEKLFVGDGAVRALPDFSALGSPDEFARLRGPGADEGTLRLYRLRWGERIEHIRVARLPDGRIWRLGLN